MQRISWSTTQMQTEMPSLVSEHQPTLVVLTGHLSLNLSARSIVPELQESSSVDPRAWEANFTSSVTSILILVCHNVPIAPYWVHTNLYCRLSILLGQGELLNALIISFIWFFFLCLAYRAVAGPLGSRMYWKQDWKQGVRNFFIFDVI